MEERPHIDIEGVAHEPWLDALVARHLARLEARFGRLVAARVVVRGPGGHHRHGGPNTVHVVLVLPGGHEVEATRAPSADERYADLRFAVDDAFHRAEHGLVEEARKLRGDVKTHVHRPVGTVARLDPAGGFGFIAGEDGTEIYFHANSVLHGGFGRLEPGARVAYHLEDGVEGPQASTVHPL